MEKKSLYPTWRWPRLSSWHAGAVHMWQTEKKGRQTTPRVFTCQPPGVQLTGTELSVCSGPRCGTTWRCMSNCLLPSARLRLLQRPIFFNWHTLKDNFRRTFCLKILMKAQISYVYVCVCVRVCEWMLRECCLWVSVYVCDVFDLWYSFHELLLFLWCVIDQYMMILFIPYTIYGVGTLDNKLFLLWLWLWLWLLLLLLLTTPMAHCQSTRLVCGRLWVRIRGRVIPLP